MRKTAWDRVPAWGGAPPNSLKFTSAGRGGACRPDETRLGHGSVKPIGDQGRTRSGATRRKTASGAESSANSIMDVDSCLARIEHGARGLEKPEKSVELAEPARAVPLGSVERRPRGRVRADTPSTVRTSYTRAR